jgi:transposase
MNFLGLVPGEKSTGKKEIKLGITKAENHHARRLLVESSWHYRHRPAVGTTLKVRRAGRPRDVIAHADKAMLRLHRRYWKLVMAVVRELAGFLWAVLYRQEAVA